MTRFLEAFASTPAYRLPFRNFKFTNATLTRESATVFDAFWEKFGPHLESLEFSNVYCVGVGIVRDILFNICPNLRKISFKRGTFFETFQNEEEGGYTLHEEIPERDPNVRVNRNLSSSF